MASLNDRTRCFVNEPLNEKLPGRYLRPKLTRDIDSVYF